MLLTFKSGSLLQALKVEIPTPHKPWLFAPWNPSPSLFNASFLISKQNVTADLNYYAQNSESEVRH